MAPNPLIGTWRLLSWENRAVVDGEVSYPLGKDAVGYIMYGADGYMSVAIMRPDRARFAAGDLLGGDAEERAQAALTYVSYCGTYEFRGETVVHRVELSLFPNWVGVEQERLIEVSVNSLTLTTRPILLRGGAGVRPPHLGGRRNAQAVALYSPECAEEPFCELRVEGGLGGGSRRRYGWLPT